MNSNNNVDNTTKNVYHISLFLIVLIINLRFFIINFNIGIKHIAHTIMYNSKESKILVEEKDGGSKRIVMMAGKKYKNIDSNKQV